ncbi:MAG: PQQ-like beta-propeller repeat protein [Acidimicrobiia bacterium]|nr:PQQ-like beta-propeller repeat protein [Acidimicrobiia bacterium]
MTHHRTASRTSPRRWSRPRILGAGLLLVAIVGAVVVAVGIARPGDADRPGRLAAGSRVGYHDPFDTRRPENIDPMWSHDFSADPTAMLVNDADTFVVTPTAVTALATASGEVRWQADVKDAEPYLAVDATSVAVGAVDGFELLDRASGASRWRAEISDPTDRARAVAIVGGERAGVVVGATDHNGLVGFDAATGALRWTSPASLPPRGRLVTDAATGSVVVVNSTDHAAQLRVLDAGTGALRWSTNLDRDTGIPMIVGTTLLVATGDGDSGVLRSFSVADGRSRWERPLRTGAEATTGLIQVAEDVVAVDSSGMVFSVAVSTGALHWRTELPGPVLADSPVVVDDVLVVHDLFAKVHTLDPRTGRLLGSRQSVGAPVALGAGVHRVVYAQAEVQYGQVIAYAPGLLRRPVGSK